MRIDTPEGDVSLSAEDRIRPSRRLALASLFTAGYAASMTPANAAAITTDDTGLIVEDVTFPAFGGTALPGFMARPARKGRFPAVLVASEIFGIHAYIKDVCKRLAKAGYVALAPDYFDRAGDPALETDRDKVMAMVATAGPDQVAGDTDAALAFLSAQKFVAAQRLAITGFCWGGAVVWMACARNPSLKAGVAWYGRLAPRPTSDPAAKPAPCPLDIVGQLKVPVLGLYGGLDKGIPLSDVTKMRAGMIAANNPTHSEIVVFPNAQHGFHADYRESYDEAAAKDGWARALTWFKAAGV